jgi:hypothetical protein
VENCDTAGKARDDNIIRRMRFAFWLTKATNSQSEYVIYLLLFARRGPGSVVGIATGYGLDGPGIESLWVARFSAPVQTGPGAHPASCTMGTGSFPGVKNGQGVTLTPQPLSSAVVIKE